MLHEDRVAGRQTDKIFPGFAWSRAVRGFTVIRGLFTVIRVLFTVFSRRFHTDFSRYGLPPGSADFRRIYEVKTTASLLVEARHSSSNSLALHQLQQLLSHILKLIRFKVSMFQLLHILYILTLVHMMLKYCSALVRKFASGQACSSVIKGEGRVIPAFSYLLLQEGNEWLELCVPPAIRNLGMTRSRLQQN